MKNQIFIHLVLIATGICLGYGGRSWFKINGPPPPSLTQSVRPHAGPKLKVEPPTGNSHRDHFEKTSLLRTANFGELAIAQRLMHCDEAELKQALTWFKELPLDTPARDHGLFASAYYLGLLSTAEIADEIFAWPDLENCLSAVEGAFRGMAKLSEEQRSALLDQAVKRRIIVPAVMGIAKVHPKWLIDFLTARGPLITERPWQYYSYGARENFGYTRDFDYLLTIAFSGWAETSPEEAYATAKKPLIGSTDARHAVLNVIRRRYPAKMTEYWQDEISFFDGVEVTKHTQWLVRLPVKDALSLLEKTPQLRKSARAFVAEFAKVDFEAAAAWVLNANPSLRIAALDGLLGVGSPEQLFAISEALPQSAARKTFERSILYLTASRTPAQALHFLNRFPTQDQREFIASNIRGLLRDGSEALVQFLGDHPELSIRHDPNERPEDWEPEIAERYLNLLPDSPENRKSLLRVKTKRLCAESATPDEAFKELLALYPDEASAGQALMNHQLGSSRKEKAIHWLENQTPTLQKEILSKIPSCLGSIGTGSPDKLLPLLLQTIPTTVDNNFHQRQDDLECIIQGLARQKSPEELRAWMESLPQNKFTAIAPAFVATEWLKSNPQAASAWVKDWPESIAKDHAAAAIVKSVIAEDPVAVEQWFAVIRDKTVQENCLREIINAIPSDNVTEARRWLDKMDDPRHRAILAERFEPKSS